MRKTAASPEERVPTPFSLCNEPKDAGVLLAFSGGADSSALLHILDQQAKQYGFSLTLVHVNHGIRGKEADRDEAFCKKTAERYGYPIFITRADLPALAKEHKRGLEEEARRLRYEVFARVMDETGAKILVTAHHADDNLETVLFRLSRGSSLKGLCGIAPTRPFGKGHLVRPLLGVSKEEILAYCREQKIDFVEDSTNAELSYSRNFIRRKLVPDFKRLFDHPETRVARMTAWLREDEAYLDSLAKEVVAKATPKGIPVEELSVLPAPILRRALCAFVTEKTGIEPDGNHLMGLLELIGQGKGQVVLPGGAIALVEAGFFTLLVAKPEEDTSFPPFGAGEWSSSGVRIRVEAGASQLKNGKSACVVAFDQEHPLFWRTRLPGERILLRGHHKEIRKCYREAFIPPRLRDRMPLLCDGEGVLFAPFVGKRDGDLLQEQPLYTVTVEMTDEF